VGKLDQNVDAYRLAATILDRLRALLRSHLEAAHGADWEKDGVPADPGEYLTQRRERESSVKWNPASREDLLDFAGFVNLHAVLSAQPLLREGFSRLVPEPQALRLRFLELDTVLNRIAYARPVSDSDMELLLGFDERLRAVMATLALAGLAAAPRPEQPLPPEVAPRPASPPVAPPMPAVEPQALAADPPARTPEPPGSAEAPEPPPVHAPTRPQQTPRPRPAESREKPMRAPGGGISTALAEASGAGHDKGTVVPPTLSKDFEVALRRGDDPAVLTALYQEITGLAETMWGDAGSVRTPVWEAVRESAWYERRFSTLRLRVVSDFYDLLRNIQERVAAGSTRADLHDFLKERNFAQLLMELRDFFRPHAGAGRPARQ
jgi:hypothetical protein